MSGDVLPVLYSFRRCPYAMRARLALYVTATQCELREVVLRDKPAHMLEISPKATVPVMQTTQGVVLEESLDIMLWALDRHDPLGWLDPEQGMRDDMLGLIAHNDFDFKPHLDRYKYGARHGEDIDPLFHRAEGEKFLADLDARLAGSPYLYGARPALADFAIAPFIRQFANTDRDWFAATPYTHLQRWLDDFLASTPFGAVMDKYAQWQPGDAVVFSPIAD